MQTMERRSRQGHIIKMYYRKVNQGPKGGWGMEISYSSSLPWGIVGIKSSASYYTQLHGHCSSANSTRFCMENAL